MFTKMGRIAGGVAALLLLPASMTLAQQQLVVPEKPDGTRAPSALRDTRWSPWLGCWTPVERKLRDQDIQVCVLPTSDGTGVRMMTFSNGQRILDEPVVADGSKQVVKEDQCDGWIQNTWSRNGARVFRVTELRCEGKASQSTSGISTMTGPNEWLDLQVATVDRRESVRTRRYVRSAEAPPTSIEQDVRALGATKFSPPRGATADDVVEANAVVSPRTVEAWLAESDAHVPVSKRTLVMLSDADVQKNVIDLLVALAYPEHFEVRRSGSSSSFGFLSGFDDFGSWSDPWGVSFDPYASYYSPFGSYRGGLAPYYLDPYYLGVGGYATIPAIGTATTESGRGRVVNGSGYTQVEPRQPPAATVRTSSDTFGQGSSSGFSSSSSDSGSSSASPAGYSSGGSDSGQTAVPR
jgi:hypothetical protein